MAPGWMRRSPFGRRSVVRGSFSLRLVAAALFALVSGVAGAQVDAAKMNAAKQAADEFLALAKGAETTGVMPRQSDPKTKALLDRVFDRAALGRGVPPIQDAKFGELLNNGNRIGFAYMLAGSGQTDLSKLADDQKAMEQAEKNMSAFAPEIGRWFDYQLAIQGKIADSTLAFIASAKKDVLERPQVQSGLGNVRQGLARSLSGVFQTMAADGLDDGWRRDRLIALTEICPSAAKLVTAEDAKELQRQATALSEAVKDPNLKAGLKKFGETIVSQQKS
jgi:hypothetical protein